MEYTYGERDRQGDQSNLLAPIKIILLSHPSSLPVWVCTDFRITDGTSMKFHIAGFYERRLVLVSFGLNRSNNSGQFAWRSLYFSALISVAKCVWSKSCKEELNPLICITNLRCTKYVVQTLTNLQHVSAHDRCHYQGVLTAAIKTTSKYSFAQRVNSTAMQLRTH